MKNKHDKGEKFGSCNRRSCQGPPAIFFNKSTRKYYCPRCADKINEACGESLCVRFDILEAQK